MFFSGQGDWARGRVWVLFTDMALRIISWGVLCLASPEECLSKAKDDATYVVQKHIPKPLLYTNGEKCHIKLLGLNSVYVLFFSLSQVAARTKRWTKLGTLAELLGCSEWNFHPIAMVIFNSNKSMIEHGQYASLMTGFLNPSEVSFCCSKLYSIDLPSSWVCWLKIVTSKYVWKGFGITLGNVAGFVEGFSLYTFKSFPHQRKKQSPNSRQPKQSHGWNDSIKKKPLNIQFVGDCQQKNL